MGATGFKGIDVRQTANGLIFRASLKNSSGEILATGTTELRLFEVQDDGSLHVFDFYASTLDFTSGTPSDDEAEMTKRTHLDDGGNPRETGIWTYKLADVSKFVKGAIYIAQVTNSEASPVDQEREFQFGDVEGDLAVTDTDLLKSDAEEWAGAQVLLSSGMAGSNVPLVAHTNDGAAKVTLASSTDKQPASLATADVTGNLPANVVDWKGSTAPAMTGDAFARLGAPTGDSIAADIASNAFDVIRSVHGQRTVFVDGTNGSNANDGFSIDTAKQTIAGAVSEANSGDLILIAPGTYTEAVDASTKTGITIRGSGPDTILTQSTGDTTLTIGDGTTVERMQVLNTGADGTSGQKAGIGGYATEKGFRLINLKIQGQKAVKMQYDTGIVLVENCDVVGTEAGLYLECQGGLVESAIAIVRNSRIYTTGWAGSDSIGINVYAVSATVENCVVSANGGTSTVTGIKVWLASPASINNSIVTATADSTQQATALWTDSSSYSASRNCVFTASGGSTPYSLLAGSGAALIVTDCVYSTTSGTITNTTLSTKTAADAVKTQTDKLEFSEVAGTPSHYYVKARSSAGTDLAVAAKQPDNKPTVDESGYTAVQADVDVDEAAIAAEVANRIESLIPTPSGVWSYSDRNLTGSVNVSPPVAYTSDADIYYSIFKNSTRALCARVRGHDGSDLTPSGVSAVVYSIYELDDHDPDERDAVTGHSAVSLTPANVLFATLQTDNLATAYNFRHTPPIGTSQAFTIAGRSYLVEYTITPTSGEKIVLRFRVDCI